VAFTRQAGYSARASSPGEARLAVRNPIGSCTALAAVWIPFRAPGVQRAGPAVPAAARAPAAAAFGQRVPHIVCRPPACLGMHIWHHGHGWRTVHRRLQWLRPPACVWVKSRVS
jgi:hypothetical protein